MNAAYQTIPSWLTFVERPAKPQSGENRSYLALAPAFLCSSRDPRTTVYRLAGEGRLEVFLEKGTGVPHLVRDKIRRGEIREHCYVPAEENDALLAYEEDALPEILEDRGIPLGGRCRALHNLATLISREAFFKPFPLSVYRQTQCVNRLVDFVQREFPTALRMLLRMAHADYSDPGHAVNVGIYGLAVALEHFGRAGDSRLAEMAEGLFLHDIGKCRLPPEVLAKAGPLVESEWREVKKHPGYGFTILEREQLLTPEGRQVVLTHHERMDGEGYPSGLRGREIHPYARVCAIADAFDALTTRRTFRPALRPFDALRIMKEEMRAQFDPEMFRALVLLMK